MSQFLGMGQVATTTIGQAFGGLSNIIWSSTSSTAVTSNSSQYYNQQQVALQQSYQNAQVQQLLAQQGISAQGQNPYHAAVASAPLGFNRFVNASDLLEEFVRFAKGLGLRRRQFLDLPIELFIQWLVIRAAEVDGDPRPDDIPDPKARILALPAPKSPWGSRCLDCGRFVPERQAVIGIVFCNGQHMDRYRARRLAA